MKHAILVQLLALMVTTATLQAAPSMANGGSSTPPPGSAGGGLGVVLPQPMNQAMVLPDCYTFTVDNASSDSIGTVTVSGLGSSADFNVTTTASYQQSVCFTAISATVNGVTITYPNSGDVQLASGVWVKVIWQSSSLIEIADLYSQNSPVRQ